jgi:hypothetical protein
LNTVAKRITDPYKREVSYPQELEAEAEKFDDLLSDVRQFLGKAR